MANGDLLALCLPNRCMGWLGFAQGVDSINCCSEDAVAAAAEDDNAEVAPIFGLGYERPVCLEAALRKRFKLELI